MSKLTATFELITPKIAAELLSSNREDNRNLRPRVVDYLTDAMLAGEYLVTHQGIGIDKTGALIDGQHRLRAVIKSGKAQTFLVTRGLDPRVYSVLDCGLSRSLADRTGETVKTCAVASTMLRLLVPALKRKVAAYEAQLVLDGMRGAFALAAECGAHKHARSSPVPSVAAAVCRFYQYADSAALAYCRSSATALFSGAIEDMSAPTLALYKYILSGKFYGHTGQQDLFVRSWIALDPLRAGSITRPRIGDHTAHLNAARDVFHIATAENFK